MKYAKQRLNELYSSKKSSLKDKFSTVGVKLTQQQKVAALKAGEFTVTDEPTSKKDSYYEPAWSAYIKFNAETPNQTDVEGLKVVENELKSKYTAAMDELMLGDNAEALRMIREFENA